VHRSTAPSTGITRRSLLAGSAAAAALSATRLGRANATPRFPAVPAGRAEALANAWGVNVHYDFQQSEYGDEQRVTDLLIDLGVRHVRNRYKPGVAAIRDSFQQLADNGCRVNAICGVADSSTQPTMAELMEGIVADFGPDAALVFSALEGVNEPNNDDIPWVIRTRSMQAELWRARSARQETSSIPVIGPALARKVGGMDKYGMTNDERTRLDYEALGDLTAYCTRGNIHVYPDDSSPSDEIDKFMGWASAVYGDLRITCTEGGYWNHLGADGVSNVIPNYTGGAHAVPEDVAALYSPRHLCEHFLRGNRLNTYQLLDQTKNADSDRGGHFGLVRSDYTLKPAFNAMRRFLDLVGDRSPRTFARTSFRPAGLRHAVAGGTADYRSLLLQRSTGEHLLVMWRDVKLYDYDVDKHAGRYLQVNPYAVTVTLDESAPVTVYRPSTTAGPAASWGSARSFDVPLSGGIVVAEIG